MAFHWPDGMLKLFRVRPSDWEAEDLVQPAPADEWHGMYQSYTVGVGGACDVYDPPRSPWCSASFYLERQFPEMHTRHPSGMEISAELKNAPYKSPEGAVIHAWRPGVR